MTKKPEDIILIGGGLTAKCLALMLSHSGYSYGWLAKKKKQCGAISEQQQYIMPE